MTVPLLLLDPIFWARVLTPAAGLYLLLRGWRGRFEGDEPHCRKCSYNLTGIPSKRCPECGALLGPKGVFLGERRHFSKHLAVGTLLLVGAAIHGGQLAKTKFQQINWWNYRPFGWVLKDAEAGTLHALNELDRRVRWNQLSVGQLHQLQQMAASTVCLQPLPTNIKAWFAILKKLGGTKTLSINDSTSLATTALERASRRPADPHLREWLDVLGELLEAGRLSEEQIKLLGDLALTQLAPDVAISQTPFGDPSAVAPVRFRRIAFSNRPLTHEMWLKTLDRIGRAGKLRQAQLERYFEAWRPEPPRPAVTSIPDGECLQLMLPVAGAALMPHDTQCEPVSWRIRMDGSLLLEGANTDPRGPCLELLGVAPGMHEIECRMTYACELLTDSPGKPVASHRCFIEIVGVAGVRILSPE